MSASTEKKNRQAAREAGTDKKILAAQEEAKNKAKSKFRWTLGTVLVVLLIAAILFLNSGFLHSRTTALTIGDETYSPAEMNFYYGSQYQAWASQYGSYASLFGLDLRAGLAGLDSQPCPMLEGSTWKDYFMAAAEDEMIEVRALCDYAEENGIELTEEEIAQVESSFDGMDEFVKAQGYSSIDNFFAANYGNGVDYKIAREVSFDSALANKVITQIAESFDYSDAELEDYYKSLNGESDIFDFSYYFVRAEAVESTDENGETVTAPNDETLAAAKAQADAIMKAYNESEEKDAAAKLDAAVVSEVEGGQATHRSNVVGSGLSTYKEWLMGSRETGDITVIEDKDAGGSYVVVFLGRSDNHYPLAQVRHILVKAQPSEDGTYTDEAKAEAKAKAEDILKQWKDGEATEESFAALAQEFSEDLGSSANGGLYDAVAKGQMVPEFDEFCFDGHKKGDTAIVYGESGSYAGYHVMYYVGEGELYSSFIAKNALLNTDVQEWLTAQLEGYEAVTGFGYRFVA